MTGMNYLLRESEITDLVMAESRIEALKALTLLLLREVESLKKIIDPKRPRGRNGAINLADELKTIEASLIKDALIRADGNQRDAAKLLATKTTTLNEKIKRLGIRLDKTISRVS